MNLKQFSPMKILSHWQVANDIINGKNPPPISCEIDLSNLCNHDCIWCMYQEFRNEKSEMIPSKTLFDLIQDLAKGGVKSVTFTGGGEPLTNSAIVKALYKVKESGMEVGLTTNGSLMTEQVCQAIIETCLFVRVSLDAATLATHNRLHRPKNIDKGNFKIIIKNIQDLLSLRKRKDFLTVGMSFLVHPLNYHEIYKVAKLAKDVGVDYIQIRPVYIAGEKLSNSILFQSQKLVEKALNLATSDFKVFPIMHRFEQLSSYTKMPSRCLGHALLSIVGADCNLYLCCQFRGNSNFSFGSLKEKSFWKIWNSQERQKVIKRIDVTKCPPCRYYKYNETLDYLIDKERLHENFL